MDLALYQRLIEGRTGGGPQQAAVALATGDKQAKLVKKR